ncbi:MAG TPA: hypothetical protein VFF81_09725 [Noviherbaspirillum sp.]|nr:hypothetical protein [Noviherbaspirillum sp.]
MIDLLNPVTDTLSHEADRGATQTALREELLPFTVKLVTTEDDLYKAVLIRHAAYGRHVPQFAETLRTPEPVDKENGVIILLAEAKLNGQPLGTMRIQTNRFRPLNLEQSLQLPQWLQGRRLAEATRLGITEDRIGRVVKTALFKAYFQYCARSGVDSMVITARSPLDRQYERLLFKDVYPEMGYIPLRHVGNMPHRVMALKVADVEPKWRTNRHPLYDYFFKICHPDISTDSGASLDFTPLLKKEESQLSTLAL